MDGDCGLPLVSGVKDDHLQQRAVAGRTDEQHPITTLPYRSESLLDGVPDIGVGDTVLPGAVRDLHNANLCCSTRESQHTLPSAQAVKGWTVDCGELWGGPVRWVPWW